MRYRNDYTIYKRGKVYYYCLARDPKRTYHSTGETVERYARMVAQSKVDLATPAAPGSTVRQYCERYYVWETCPHTQRLLNEGKSITRRHVVEQRRLLKLHVFEDAVAKIPLDQLRRADLLDFRERLRKDNGPRVVNRTIGALRTIFQEGVYREELPRNPCLGMGPLKYEQRERGIFTQKELLKMFPSNPPGPWMHLEAYCCFLVAATTGMRRGEILALEWRHLDFKNKLVMIEQAWKGIGEMGKPKSGKTRVMPIPQYTLDRLLKLPGAHNPTHLVFHHKGTRISDQWWTFHFREMAKTLRLKAAQRHLSPHCFRHTLNTILRSDGVDPAQVRSVLGWTTEDVQDGYTHWTPEHLGAVSKAVESLMAQKKARA